MASDKVVWNGQRLVSVAAVLVIFLALAVILQWGQTVLVPIALAILLTFILSPLVTRLNRLGVSRLFAVLIVVAVAAAGLGLTGWMIAGEVRAVLLDLPRYRTNIRDKVHDLTRLTGGGIMRDVQTTVDEVAEDVEEEVAEVEREQDEADGKEPELDPDADPIPVRIVPQRSSLPLSFSGSIAPFLGPAGTAGLVCVLVIFMLVQREDLRNRVVSLAGNTRVAVTTKALDDAGRRISRYLLMQAFLNITYGLAAGLGLLMIGVPHSLLWGFCAAIFRYVPYLGPTVGATLPLLLSVITSSGWMEPLLVGAMFLTLELVSNNLLEPLLYGHSVGVSAVGLLVSAIFWTWLWGPVGLILATPLTVCLVVVSRFVPGLSFIDRLLGDQPALEPHFAFYQRLLARDLNEAAEIVEEYLEERGLENIYDDVLLPSLVVGRRDRNAGVLSEEDERYLETALLDIVDNLPLIAQDLGISVPPLVTVTRHIQVLGLPSHDRLGAVALAMVAQTLRGTRCDFELLPAGTLSGDVIARIQSKQPAALCLATLSSVDAAYVRLLCKRLARQFDNLPILVGYWGGRQEDKHRERFRAAGADHVSVRIAEMRSQLVPIIQFHAIREAPEEVPAGSETG